MIDLDKVKRKLSDLESKNDRTNYTWKPEPGKQVVRIVPYKWDPSFPFIELYFDYEVTGKSILSPVTYGRPDPIAEFAKKLKATGSSDDYALGKKVEPKERYFAPIIVRGEEEEGVKFWGFGKTVYAELLAIISDPDYGDISDLENGRDITIEFKKGEGKKSYPTTEIRVKPVITPVSTKESILEVLDNQKKIEDIFPEPTYDELKTMLENYLNPDTKPEKTGETEEESEETEQPKKSEVKTPVASTSNTSKSAEDLNEKFKKLFDKKK